MHSRQLYIAVLSTLFGFDFFISYRRSDARSYADELHRVLTAAGFICFIDREEALPGDPLTRTITRALRRSRFLLAIVTPGVVQSDWVMQELGAFRQRKRAVIPVDVGGFLKSAVRTDVSLSWLRDISWLDESAAAVAAGTPSAGLIEQLEKALIVRFLTPKPSLLRISVGHGTCAWGTRFGIGVQGHRFHGPFNRRLRMPDYFRRTWPAVACAIVAHQAAAALPSHPIVETFAPTAAETQGGTVSTLAGTAVAIQGGTALLGMPGIDKVGIFSRNNAGWTRTGSITPPQSAPSFGRSLAYCDDTIVVGAKDAAYVFRLIRREWRFTAKLTSPALHPLLGFPTTLDCHNDVVAVGDDRVRAPGAVYIYELNRAGRLVSRRQLQLQDGQTDDGFGAAVALGAGVLVVGAPGSEGGSAYIYGRSARGWLRSQRLHAVDSENELFGAAVAINKGLIIVGAPNEDPLNADSFEPPIAAGAAFTFARNSRGQYVETDRIRPSSADLSNFIAFGDQIETSGNFVAIHAIELIGGPGDFATGYVATYTLSGAQTLPLAITPFHPQLNSSLDLWRSALLIGQPLEERCGFDVCIGQANLLDLTELQ